jgi:hypothetical protein
MRSSATSKSGQPVWWNVPPLPKISKPWSFGKNVGSGDVSLADFEVEWRICIDPRLQLGLARKNPGELRRRRGTEGGFQMRSFEKRDGPFSLPKILQAAVSPKISRAHLDQRTGRFAPSENSVASNQHPAPGERQVTAEVGIQLDRCLARNQSKESPVSDQMVEAASCREISGDSKSENAQNCD